MDQEPNSPTTYSLDSRAKNLSSGKMIISKSILQNNNQLNKNFKAVGLGLDIVEIDLCKVPAAQAVSPNTPLKVSFPTSSPTTVEPVRKSGEKLNCFDRRTSLPALGIDLGRSVPSYGRTLKRSSVAVYGMANRVHDRSTKASSFSAINNFKCANVENTSTNSAGHNKQQNEICLNRVSEINSINDGDGNVKENRPDSDCARDFQVKKSSRIREEPNELKDDTGKQANSNSMKNPQCTRLDEACKFRNYSSLRTERDMKARTTVVSKELVESHEVDDIEANVQLSLENDLRSGPRFSRSRSQHRFQSQKKSILKFEENSELRGFRLRKKAHVIRELIETERRYLDSLNRIQSYYLLPILQSQKGSNLDNKNLILDKKTTTIIFSNFEAILGLSQHFLSELESLASKKQLVEERDILDDAKCEKSNSNSEDQTQTKQSSKALNTVPRDILIGGTLLKFLPFFKLYSTFISNFSLSQSTLLTHSAKNGPNPAFFKLLSECKAKGFDGGLGLSTLLLGVIQRVPRYELMIRDLLKYSVPQGDLDYDDLVEAMKMVCYVARSLELGIREQEETKKILTIQRSMDGLSFPLVTPSRKLLKLGRLKKVCRRGDLHDRVFFLFNDCLIYAGIIKPLNTDQLDFWMNSLDLSDNPSKLTTTNNQSTTSSGMQRSSSLNLLLNFGFSEDTGLRMIFCRKLPLDDITTVGTTKKLGSLNLNASGFHIISSAKSFTVSAFDTAQMQDWINALREAKYEYLNGRRSLFINEDGNKSSFHKPDARSIPSRGVSWLSLTSSDSSQSNSTRLESINLIVNPTRNVERSGNGSGGIPNAPIIKSQDSMDTHTWSSKIPPRQDEILEKSNLNSSSFSWKSLIRRSLTTITRNQYSSEVSRADSEEISTTDPNKMVEEESQSSSTNSQKIPNQPALSDAPTLVVAENYSAPVWVPDNDVRLCMGNCSSRFGLLTRRHHCRLCGGVFCACCSSKTFVITSSEEGDKLARSCNSCYQSIFLDPRETQPYINYNKSLGNEAKDKLSSSDSRPYDDLDLTTAEENSRKAHLRRDYRQSLPTSLAAANLKQNPGRTLVEDPRTSMVSSTSLGQDSVSAGRMSCFSSPLINCNSSEADDVIVNLNTLVTGVDSDARKKLSSLLNKSG